MYTDINERTSRDSPPLSLQKEKAPTMNRGAFGLWLQQSQTQIIYECPLKEGGSRPKQWRVFFCLSTSLLFLTARDSHVHQYASRFRVIKTFRWLVSTDLSRLSSRHTRMRRLRNDVPALLQARDTL
ncbi:MAG: hypothetical protein RLZZ308_599 [Candidatus Parcubacteria bacterium]|jgi:hypothetical protein